MNQLTSLLSKVGIGGSSQDEGKAASKHPDAEARLADVVAACIPIRLSHHQLRINVPVPV